jgi:hypothetical protein
MLTIIEDARLQVTAATSLLECSRLVKWQTDITKFIPVSEACFETTWKKIHPVFGRLICWINFSAGAELLAKGVCLAREVEIRKLQEVPAYPTEQDDLALWADHFVSKPCYAGTKEVAHFGTLGDLVKKKPDPKNPAVAAFKRLCLEVKASQQEEQRFLAAYILLQKSIRNRDAHAYIRNVRGQHFSLVPKLFTEVFNQLVSWLPGGPKELNDWREAALNETGPFKP